MQDTNYLVWTVTKKSLCFKYFTHPNTKYMSLSHWVGKQFKTALRLLLWPPCLRTICFSFTYILCRVCFPVTLYYSDGDILSVLLRQRLILAVSPIFSFTSASPTFHFFCCFAPGRFARFHVRPESFRITVATSPHVVSSNNRFYKMFLSAITFAIDVDISLYSSLHSVENV